MNKFLRALFFTSLFAIFSPSIVNAQSVSFTGGPSLSGCDSLFAFFTPRITGCSSTTLKWFFIKGTRVDSADVGNYMFNQIGSYDVVLRVKCDSSYIYDTMYNYVTVSNSPQISFATRDANDTNLNCGPRYVRFVNTSVADTSCAHTWTWILTGPSTSVIVSTDTFSYNFTVPGTYDVTLLFFAPRCGCFGFSAPTHGYIKIDAPATPCFTSTADSIYCGAPATVSYNASCATGVTSRYVWQYGDGRADSSTTPTTTHTFTAPGYYTATLTTTTAGSCRTDTADVHTVHVGNFTAAMAPAVDTVCQLNSVMFSDSSTVGGTAATVEFYILQGADTVDRGTGMSINFSAAYPPPHDYGSYTVVEYAADANGCTSTTSQNIYVRPNPRISALTTDSTYKCSPPLTVHFGSTIVPSGAYRYTWSFGPGSTATTSGIGLTSPTHTYTGSGTFSPTLTVTDVHGCKDDSVALGRIKTTLPAFNFSKFDIDGNPIDSGCGPLFVRYSTQLLDPPTGVFITDTVMFSDGSAPCLGAGCQDSTHTFSDTGWNYITLIYHLPDSLGGCTGILRDSVKVSSVRPEPGYRFLSGADTVCPGSLIQIVDSCTSCSYTSFIIQTSALTSASGLSDTVQAVLVTGGQSYNWSIYQSAGGCNDTITGSVYVRPPVPGSITFDKCIGSFIVGNHTPGLSYYRWSFIGPAPSTTRRTYVTTTDTLRLTLSTAGIYTVSVLDSAGPGTGTCSATAFMFGADSLSRSLFNTVPSTRVRALDTSICANVTDTIFLPTLPGPTTYSSYRIYWGDGSLPNPQVYTSSNITDTIVGHTFTRAGVYDVMVVGNSSCLDTFPKRRIWVNGPTGGFYGSTIECLGNSITFTDTSRSGYPPPRTSGARTNIVSRRWYMNSTVDPTFVSTSGATLNYTYPSTGTYMIRLHDSDQQGCVNDFYLNVAIKKPRAHFYSLDTMDNLCRNMDTLIRFHCTDTGYTYSWNFGDGTGWSRPSVTAKDTAMLYRANGLYSVSLAIISIDSTREPLGCSDTLTKRNYIRIRDFNFTSTNYGNDSEVSCPPLRIVRFSDTPGGIPRDYTVYQWIVTSSYGIDTFRGPLLNASIYGSGPVRAVLYGKTRRGCVDSEVYHYNIKGPSGQIIVTPDTGGCAPRDVTIMFQDTAAGGSVPAGSRYIWTTCPFGSFSTLRNDTTLRYTTPGTFCPPILTIQSGSCAYPIRNLDSIRIFPIPNVSITPNPVAVLCYGGATFLSAHSDQPMESYTWRPLVGVVNPSDSGTSVNPLVTTTYTVTGSTINHCVDTAIVVVRVDSPLHITITGKPRVCQGVCDTLVASGVPGALYAWEGVGISCAVCETNIICINKSRTFTVTATNPNNCQTTDSFHITIDPLPVLHVTPDPAYVCKYGEGTQLTADGALKYVWKPLVGINCDSCADPLCDVQANIIYTITGTSQYGCVDSIAIPVTVYDTVPTSIGRDTSICIDQSVRLFASGGVKYQWLPTGSLDDATAQRPLASPKVTTIYTVYITENVCFKDTLSVKVNVVPQPIIQLPPGVEIIAGNAVQLYVDTLNSVKLVNFLWTPSDTTLSCYNCARPIATPLSTTTYFVTASTKEGCAASGSVTIRVLCQGDQIFIPNTFTPNGDGLNDRFYVSGKGLGSIKHMAVYNRWGEKLYEANNVRSNDAGTGWDGTYKGEVLPPDVYMYVIDVLCSAGEMFSFKGDISLVR